MAWPSGYPSRGKIRTPMRSGGGAGHVDMEGPIGDDTGVVVGDVCCIGKNWKNNVIRGTVTAFMLRYGARGLSSCSFLHVFPQQSAAPDSPVGLDSAGCASSSSAAGSAQVIATAVATTTAAAGRPICLSASPRAKPGLRTSWRSQLLREGSRKGADPRSKIGPAVSCGPPVSAPTPRGLPRAGLHARAPAGARVAVEIRSQT
eukprot:COSAG02_NODE_1190_length_13989_cov_9.869978_8_plen_203_part_00